MGPLDMYGRTVTINPTTKIRISNTQDKYAVTKPDLPVKEYPRTAEPSSDKAFKSYEAASVHPPELTGFKAKIQFVNSKSIS